MTRPTWSRGLASAAGRSRGGRSAPGRRRSASAMSRIWRPMSSSRPTPCEAIAARTSGASAIRSISFCASSEASSRSQTWSTSSRVEHLDGGALDRRAGERALERFLRRLGLEHPDDRPLDRRALERAHDRLLGRALDRVVDPGRRRRPARRRSSADPEQTRGQRRTAAVAWRSRTSRRWSRLGRSERGWSRAGAGAQQTTARLNASVGLLVTTSTAFGKPAPANPAETDAGGVPAVVAATGTQPSML